MDTKSYCSSGWANFIFKISQEKKKSEETTEDVPVSLFTPGRVLWKRFLMKLQ
jgi:hypothetical protein